MNLPNEWKEVGHDWFDGPNGTQVAVRTNLDNTRWYASLRGQERATKEEAERDAERLAFALEPPPEREGVARALYEDGRTLTGAIPWSALPASGKLVWFSVADTAIRLCGGVRGEVPEGWPEGWTETYDGDCRVQDPGDHVAYEFRLPNTEPGRLAAWKLEGRDTKAAEPAKSIWACPRHGGPQLDVVCPSCGMDLIEVANADAATALKTAFAEWEAHHRRAVAQTQAETRAAIDSRDQAGQEVTALRDLLKKANEEIGQGIAIFEARTASLRRTNDAQASVIRELETRLDEARTIAVRGRA